MEQAWRVKLKDGNYKYFYGSNAELEANAYEVEMKQREIEKQERQRKSKEQLDSLRNKIEEQSKELYENIKKYDELGGENRVDIDLSLFGSSYYRYFGEWSKKLGKSIYSR